MKNKFRLGLVAEIKNEAGHPSRPVRSEDWKSLLDFFRLRGELVLFDWRDLGEDFSIPRIVYGSKNSLEVIEGKLDIRDFCNVVYVGQLGKLYDTRSQFLGFLDVLEKFPGRIVNPLGTIRENLSKQYLLELQDCGISVVPTLDVDNNCSLESLVKMVFPNYNKPFDDLVLKPKFFGERGEGVVRLSQVREGELESYLGLNGETIVQPLINEIYTLGENSFVFVGRDFSHGLNKITGNFKINFCDSSRYTPREPTKGEMELCQAVLDVWPTDFVYTRIDIIPSEKPLVSEVEMVNPALYLTELGCSENYASVLNKKLNEMCAND